MKELVVLKQLEGLGLSFTKVTDAGVKELAAVRRLDSVALNGTKEVTEAGVKELRKARPAFRIAYP